MAKNTGRGKRVGLIRGRYQKFNPVSGLWDKYDLGGTIAVRSGQAVLSKRSSGSSDAIRREDEPLARSTMFSERPLRGERTIRISLGIRARSRGTTRGRG